MTQGTIEVKNLYKQFGQLQAVRDVSFIVSRGDVLGFLGPNGAGKSTTMKMITGFLEPSGGTIRVCGHDVSQAPLEVKSRIGYLPEGAPLYGEMTVSGFLEFIAEVRRIPKPQRRSRIDDAIAKIQLQSVLTQRIETLSKGFKRRVGLAQAILHDPDVLILDEPTDGLDPNQKHEVRTLITEMAADKAIVISTHILEEVDAVCNKVIIIASGQLVFQGSPDELEARSRYHNAIRIRVAAAEAQAVRSALTARQDIQAVEDGAQDAESVQFLVLPKNGGSIITGIGEAARREGWTVSELRVEAGHLDEVFRTITIGAAGT